MYGVKKAAIKEIVQGRNWKYPEAFPGWPQP